MGGTSTPSPESMQSVLQAYSRYLPGLVSSTAAQQPGIAQNQLNATMATQPLYNALNLQQAQQYSVPLAQVGQDVQRSNALAGSQTNLQQLLGAGGQSAVAAEMVNRAANPNYYKTQDAASNRAAGLVNSIDTSGRLSGGELAAVERSNNRSNTGTGNLGLANPTNTISNAMNFGNLGYQRQQQGLQNLNQAIGTANQTSGMAQNSGFSPVNIALGQPNANASTNFGTGTFSNTNANTQASSGQNAFGFGQGLLGNMSSMNNAFTGAAAQQSAAQMGVIGQVCCFIMMEAYHGNMPLHVRICRDRYYRTLPQVAIGYKRMASWLVPLMHDYSLVRSAVWHIMIKPLTEYGAFVTRKSTAGRNKKWSRKLWFSIWNYLGQ